MTASLFHLNPLILNALRILAAAAVASLGFFLFEILLRKSRHREVSRLESYLGESVASKGIVAPVGSFEHRVRLAFARYGIDPSGRETFYLWMARLVSGGILFLGMLLVGLPLATSLIGFLGGYVFANGWVSRAWNKVRTDVEAEIPSLLMRLSATAQTTQNVPGALEIVAGTLRQGGPLRSWTLESATRMHRLGHPAMESIRKDAAAVSPSLAIAADLIGRMWTTGGEAWAKAFGQASENIESVLDARVLARAKGAGAQGTVNLLMGVTFAMIVFMIRNEAMASIVQQPLVQLVYAGIVLVIVFGYTQINEIIENAV